jgi:hypothetical protein
MTRILQLPRLLDRCQRRRLPWTNSRHPRREEDDARVEDRQDRSPGDIDLSARARADRGDDDRLTSVLNLVKGCDIGHELAHQDHSETARSRCSPAAYLLFDAGYRNSLSSPPRARARIRAGRTPPPARRPARKGSFERASCAERISDRRNLDHLAGSDHCRGLSRRPRCAVLTTAAVLITATIARLVAQFRRRRSARRARADVAHACTVPASYLRVGQVPSAALAIAAAACDVLREGHQAHTLGGDVVAVWRQQAQRAGHKGLLELARAWQIAVGCVGCGGSVRLVWVRGWIPLRRPGAPPPMRRG